MAQSIVWMASWSGVWPEDYVASDYHSQWRISPRFNGAIPPTSVLSSPFHFSLSFLPSDPPRHGGGAVGGTPSTQATLAPYLPLTVLPYLS